MPRCAPLRILGTSLSLLLAASVVSGCASLWEQNFRGNPLASVAAAPTTSVTIREVPWSRLDATLSELGAQAAASDVSPVDWSPERKAQAKAELLRGLQVSEEPARVEVLGSSRFRTTDPVSPDDGSLAKYAERIGANLVVWSSFYVGKADRVTSQPVTSVGWNSWGYPCDSWGGGSVWNDGTTWVPVVVSADEFAWAAFFLRVQEP